MVITRRLLIMIAVLFSSFTLAYSVEFQLDGIRYEVIDSAGNEVRIIKNAEAIYGDVLIIPESVVCDGIEYVVVAIESEAFADADEVRSITLPPSIKKIDNYAFGDGKGLEAVYISDLEAWCKIDFYYSNPLCSAHNLFLNGKLVTDLVLPESVKKIKKSAFMGATCLKSVKMHCGVIEIEPYAFCECSELESIEIPESVKIIGEGAFEACSSLKNVYLPSNIEKISEGLFRNCVSLESVNIPYGVTEIDQAAFLRCKKIKHIVVPVTVKKIADGAFWGCDGVRLEYQ